MRKVTVLVALIILSQVSFSYALNPGTHKAINEYIANNSLNSFSLDSYLKSQLGLQSGVDEKFNSLEVWKWLRDGGEYEDEPPWNLPYIRSLNHFHNPITEEGLKSNCLLGLCVSSTVWALMPLGTQSLLTGNYSWYDVRDYYYKALTSTDKTTRDTNFSQTFRGLGQLMHLIQDVSVPAHTRDDGHLFYNYEDYAGFFVKSVGVPTPPSTAFFSGTISSIASFIDTNQYNGTNPNVAVGNAIGLSEYTNANFVSEDTLFTFPYPSKNTSVQVVDYDYPDPFNPGNYVKRQYYKKVADGEINGGMGYRLAGVDYLKFYRDANLSPTQADQIMVIPLMDENVYSDYASLLLPRAVGYSAGLLNYFFRGNMDFTIDANDREDGVKGVKISNRSNEDMDGTFSLYYDTADTNRHLLGSWNISLASQGASQVLSFPLPQDYYKYKYTLAFRGKMGTEQDAVAGYQYTGWREEWDNGLRGNHRWLYSDLDTIWTDMNGYLIDVFWGNISNGRTVNDVRGGRLINENIRYEGDMSVFPRINQTLITDAFVTPRPQTWPYCLDSFHQYCYPYDFGEEFPILITKNTWVSIKIDEMTINEPIPYKEACTGPVGKTQGAFQGVSISFDNGIVWLFSAPGHEPVDSYIFNRMSYIELGKEWSYNIFATFKDDVIEFKEPVNIRQIDIVQQLQFLCERSTIEHIQRIVVDYIRIEER